MDSDVVRYVALGDSYTIGTSVEPDDRWPNQLVAWLDGASASAPGEMTPLRLQLVANLAVNGFTSADVIRAELPRLAALRPGFVSLLIGVNDVIRGVPEDAYRANVAAILVAASSGGGSDRCLFVTTPDYTVTPAGADFGAPAAVAERIRRFNELGMAVAEEQRVAIADIHDLSLRAAEDRRLVAGDGLHPSGLQYSLWVDRIAPVVAGRLVHRGN